MKGSEAFKTTIENHLQLVADNDPAFKVKFENPEKKIDDCITYILNTVQKSGNNGFAPEEIYGMAMHYYDEEKIDIGKAPSNMRVVVDHVVELTETEIAEAKKKALNNLISQEQTRLSTKKKAPVKPTAPAPVSKDKDKAEPVKAPVIQQASLF